MTTTFTELERTANGLRDRSSYVRLARTDYLESTEQLVGLVSRVIELANHPRLLADEDLQRGATKLLSDMRYTERRVAQTIKKSKNLWKSTIGHLIQWWYFDEVIQDLRVIQDKILSYDQQLLHGALNLVMIRMNAFILSLGEDQDKAAEIMGIPEMSASELAATFAAATYDLTREDISSTERSYQQLKVNLLRETGQFTTAAGAHLVPPSNPAALEFEMQKDTLELEEYEPISNVHFSRATIPVIETEAAILDTIRLIHALLQNGASHPPPILAKSLCDVALALSKMQWQEEASMVVSWKTRLSDLATLEQPDYVTSLNKLASCLGALDRPEEGLRASQDAVEVCRDLVNHQGGGFLPHLARTLNNLSYRLSSVGQDDDALSAMQEAIRLYRELNLQSDLATALGNLPSRFQNLDRKDDALDATRETMRFYQKLAEDQPTAFSSLYASSLNNLSFLLTSLGHRPEALKTIEKAVECYRSLAKDLPIKFRPCLAICLINLSAHMSSLDRHVEELRAIEEAVEIRREFANVRPTRFNPPLVRSLFNLASSLAHVNRAEDSMAASEEAVALQNTYQEA